MAAEGLVALEIAASPERASTSAEQRSCRWWQQSVHSLIADLVPACAVLSQLQPLSLGNVHSLQVRKRKVPPALLGSMAWSCGCPLSKQKVLWQALVLHAAHMP